LPSAISGDTKASLPYMFFNDHLSGSKSSHSQFVREFKI
jgi:hypothetical protein